MLGTHFEHSPYLQGEQMGPTEAREAFFATTRLFQSKDVTLRRMVHLVIKELPTAPDDAIIATSRLLFTFF